MKRQFTINPSSNVGKSILKLTLASLFFFLIIPSVPAQNPETPVDPLVAIRYIGTLHEKPVFQIAFENETAQTFYVSIKDDEGNVLYNEKVKDLKYNKKFQIERGSEYTRLTFTLSSEKEHKAQVFQINTNTRMIQDVVVTKL